MRAYRRSNNAFEAKRADQLREAREAGQIAEMTREIQDEVVPWIVALMAVEREAGNVG